MQKLLPMAGVQLISVSPTSREKDIFGKELSLTGSPLVVAGGLDVEVQGCVGDGPAVALY